MPHRDTISQWANTNEAFSGQYTRAREERGWSLAEQAIEIADTPVEGVVETDKVDRNGDPYTEQRRADAIEHRRLQVDTRKWFASKLNKRLNDKVIAEHSGPDGAPIPVATTLTPVDYTAALTALRAKYGERPNNAG